MAGYQQVDKPSKCLMKKHQNVETRIREQLPRGGLLPGYFR
ncbi:hypothetical protein KNP414_03849 [Paenibacillus mucilaginosus KNP414]|uniref:Uncharacterized protein n=1 Tax=Paenibacillus mucilaginosus (strain KNP414) TaxID=1036673 RepID=F8F6B4_PAEMK|nr:hypothetical protein KNP414_03849 [Paenibacillus mucilaginosus KNP414]